MNQHLYSFLISFTLFIFLLDRRKIHINIYGGIIGAVYQLIQNLIAHYLNLWKYNNVSLFLPNSALFSETINIFTVGYAFTMGCLFLQFLPRNIYLQLFHTLLWGLFYYLSRYIMHKFSVITYIHFSVHFSMNILTFLFSLVWFNNTFLRCYKPKDI